MEAVTDISVNSNIRPASFHSGIVKLDLQISLIIKLLVKSIKEQNALSKEDVIDCYLDFCFIGGTETIYRRGLDMTSWDSKMDGNVTRLYLKNKIPKYTERLAIDWFRKHLGSAILKGKLLAIPIIDI